MLPGKNAFIHTQLPVCPNCASSDGECDLGEFRRDSVEFECSCDKCSIRFTFFLYYTGHIIIDEYSLLPSIQECGTLSTLSDLYVKWSRLSLSKNLRNLSADEAAFAIRAMPGNENIPGTESHQFVTHSAEYRWLNTFIKQWEIVGEKEGRR